MTPREAHLRQIAAAKASMGELRSANGGSVEALIAKRAAEPTRAEFHRKCLEGITAQGTHPKSDPSKCWFCQDEGRVEWDGIDPDGNFEQGVHDPCPWCGKAGDSA